MYEKKGLKYSTHKSEVKNTMDDNKLQFNIVKKKKGNIPALILTFLCTIFTELALNIKYITMCMYGINSIGFILSNFPKWYTNIFLNFAISFIATYNHCC